MSLVLILPNRLKYNKNMTWHTAFLNHIGDLKADE